MSSSAKPDSSFALIGIDGGATEVRTHHVVIEGSPPDAVFRLGEASASRTYERVVGFRPVDPAEQFRQRGAVQLSPVEVEQGRCYVRAACESVRDVARQLGQRRVLIGMGMPGLKTADGRGIEIINNGPRIPDFLDDLEQGLHDADLELAAPIFRLGSDADYCGMGEEYARDGMFRDVQNAYYLGGGTGLADAMKLMGRLVPFDEAKPWIQKAWQIPSSLGPTFEKLASAQGMSTVYANLLGESPSRRRGGRIDAGDGRAGIGRADLRTHRHRAPGAGGEAPPRAILSRSDDRASLSRRCAGTSRDRSADRGNLR
jgi:hypothetical protein